MSQAAAQVRTHAAAAIRPVDDIPPAALVESILRVPPSINPERHGAFSFDGFPFAKAILEAHFEEDTRVGLVCASPQFFKTMLMVAGITVASHKGGPQMYVTSALNKRTEFATTRLKPMIEASPKLWERIAKESGGGPDDRWYKQELIAIGGNPVHMSHAGTASSLSQTTAQWFWGDEPAKWRQRFKKEGGAVGLAKERVKAFPQTGKVFFASTPPQILDEPNDFWDEFCSGTVELWYCRCPHCEFEGAFELGETIDYPFLSGQKFFHPKHDLGEKATLQEIADGAKFVCPGCGASLSDQERAAMIEEGRFVAQNKQPVPGYRSFWVNRLYQPGVRIGEFLAAWIRANRKPKDLAHFLLQEMCRPYRPPNLEKKLEKHFAHLRSKDPDYRLGSLPGDHTARAVAMFADVQELFIPWSAWALNNQSEAWLINYGDVYEFDELDELLNGFASELKLPAHGGILDAGHRTRDVYDWCWRHQRRGQDNFPIMGWVPAMGRDMAQLMKWSADLQVNRGQKGAKAGFGKDIRVLLWQNLGWKDELYKGVMSPDAKTTLKLHLPNDLRGREHLRFFQEHTAEEEKSTGRGKRLWDRRVDKAATDLADCTLEMLVYMELYRGKFGVTKAPIRLDKLHTVRA